MTWSPLQIFVGRISLIIAAHFLAFELIMQLGVHWRESSEEIALLLEITMVLTGIAWAVAPIALQSSRATHRLFALGLGVLSLVVFQTATQYYSWTLRPNVGLYQEPDWVSQHPEFQRQQRARIQAKLWKQ